MSLYCVYNKHPISCHLLKPIFKPDPGLLLTWKLSKTHSYCDVILCNIIGINRPTVGNTVYPACCLLGEWIHQIAYAMVCHNWGVEEELLVAVDFTLDAEVIRHEWVPVVKGIKFRWDPVLVLETLVKEELWIKFKLQVVATQVLHIFLNYNLDGLTYRKEWQEFLKRVSKNITWHTRSSWYSMKNAERWEWEYNFLWRTYINEIWWFDNRALSADREVKVKIAEKFNHTYFFHRIKL